MAGVDDGIRVKLDAYTENPDAIAAADVVLLAVRSGSTRGAIESLLPNLRGDADIVSLQNGLNEDTIASLVGAERTIGCVVGIGATWIEPGRISLDADGALTIGRLDGTSDQRLESVRGLLEKAFPTKISDNIRGDLWGKMLVNSMTVLGALGGMLTGELLATPERRRLVAVIVAEGVKVGMADDIDVPPVFGAVPAELVDDEKWFDVMERILLRVAETFGAIKSVTWRDFELGRPTEIDAVTGEIVGRGEAHRVPTPLSSMVYAMLREIEAGSRRPDRSNLDALGVGAAS